MISFIPVQIPPLFHAVDLQMHVNAGSLYSKSEPVHPIHTVALVQSLQLLLQANLSNYFFFTFIYIENNF
jgi:hypothetical protein